MKKLLTLLSFTFLLTACNSGDPEIERIPDSIPGDADPTAVDAGMAEAEENTLEEVSRASFMSEHDDFEYSLEWDTELLVITDDQYEGASENAPSFDVIDGGHISILTNLIDSPGYSMDQFVRDNYYGDIGGGPTELPDTTSVGPHEVYLFDIEYPGCTIQHAVIPVVNEAIGIRLEECDDNAENGLSALNSLLEGLSLEKRG